MNTISSATGSLASGQRSAPDLILQLTTAWQQSLDVSEETFVIALGIAGAFVGVVQDIIAKLKSPADAT